MFALLLVPAESLYFRDTHISSIQGNACVCTHHEACIVLWISDSIHPAVAVTPTVEVHRLSEIQWRNNET